jgi:hypothetical protein
VAVIFGHHFEVLEAYEIPIEIVRQYVNEVKHVRGDYLRIEGELLRDPAVRNVTQFLQACQNA